MKRKKTYYDITLFALMGVCAFLPMTQRVFGIFKTKPLNGVIIGTEKPKWNMNDYVSGKYQRESEQYVAEHFGFRENVIRLYNQYLYGFYHKTYSQDVVIGKEGWLFYPQSVRDYYGQELLRWHPSVDEAQKKFDHEVKYLNWARDILKENGVDLLVFMAPEKSFLYPEFLPEGKRNPNTFNACDYFAQRFTETGLPYIEMTNWFLQIKDTVDYPLIPQAGAHWIFPSVYAVDTLSRLMGELKGIKLPKIKIGEAYNIRENDHDYDNDLELLLNLSFPLRHQYGYCPRHRVSVEHTPTTKRPKVLFIGNSYFWSMNLFVPFDEMFETTEFWYYFSTAYYGQNLKQTADVRQFDIVERLLDFDYVVWFTTGNQMNKGTSDFAAKAILNLCYSKKDIDNTYRRIIDSLALATDLSLADSNNKQQLWSIANRLVYDHPEHYFPELASDCLPTIRNPRIKEVLTINEIKKDSVWMQNLSAYQTLIQNASLQQVLLMEAHNIIDAKPLLRDEPDMALRSAYIQRLNTEKERGLLSLPAMTDSIRAKARLTGKTFESQLHYDAAWMVHALFENGTMTFPDKDELERLIWRYDYLESPAFDSLVETIKQQMLATPATVEAIKEKAASKNRTWEEQLQLDARWVANDKVMKGLLDH